MADLYGNPYLPSFVRNQPKIADPAVSPVLPVRACQITSVPGFAGARQHLAALTNGSSEIVAESDPNQSRVYILAVDQNGQRYVQGFDLVPVEEPKPVTIDDLNNKLNTMLERLSQLEEGRVSSYAQSGNRNAYQSKSGGRETQSTDRVSQGSQRSNGGREPNGPVES